MYSELKMKKIAAASLISVLVGCGGGDPADLAGVDSAASAATNSAFVGGDASAAVDSRAFLIQAYEHGLAEIALSERALQNATDNDVRKFAERMIGDHTQANEKIRQLAQQKNIALPSEMTSEHRTMLQNLTDLTGMEFDRVYMHHNLMVHELDVAQFRAQAESAADPDIRKFAANNLPTLQAHLLAAKGINGKIDSVVFLKNMYVDGKAESLLSDLALQKSTDAAVREFAGKMINDHTQANNEIMQMAQSKNINLPTEISVEHRIAHQDLLAMSGPDFDRAYMNHNVLVHVLGVEQAKAQSERRMHPDIAALADRKLPILSMHRQSAIEIYQRIEPSLLFAAFQNEMGEILLSKLALQKSANAEVQQFARKMIDDHSRLNAEIKQLAKSKNRALPHEISPEQFRDYINMSQMNGHDFDRAYMQRNVEVHERDVRHFEEHSQSETDPNVHAFAAASLPLLREHLESARNTGSRLDAASP
jgi:predicted outer membrane protein